MDQISPAASTRWEDFGQCDTAFTRDANGLMVAQEWTTDVDLRLIGEKEWAVNDAGRAGMGLRLNEGYHCVGRETDTNME